MDHPCPEPQRLLGLIDGTLPDDEQAGLTAHLEHCTQCQRDLEELAGGTDWLADKARYLGDDGSPKETALKDVEEVLKVAGPEEETANVASAAAEVSLDFLDPPKTPGHLGRLGAYEVIEVIGSGGMCVVLKAFEESLNRAVAIKVLSPALGSNATARRRFIREAQAAAAVSHDHVVTIHAVDEANGLPYLVMQYVSGMSLEEKIAQAGPLEVKEVLRIGMQIASGLAAAHAQGLIHRDIKPANILLENGVERVKITDFGLARAVDDASVTETGVVAGTPQYMAPEQARGDAVDHRADLFSLGSVLYATCTGRPPFRGTQTLAVLRRVADETPPSILELNCELPVWLAEIVERLHAKDPGQRYQSADEVARVLAGHLARLQQPASPGVHLDPVFVAERTPSGKAKEGRRVGPTPKVRRRWMAAAVAVLVFAGGLGITEATDVTRVTEYVATVLRIRTLQGTLVVKVDDPDVEVTVEGDGETITLRGVGAHEIRLRPGRHKVEAIRDGRAISTEWATITRGGKEVVTVNLEGEVAEGAAALDRRPIIRGRAYLGDPSRPAANQKLWLYDADTMKIVQHLETDGQGQFSSGPVELDGYFLIARMVDSRTGDPTEFFVQSRPLNLSGSDPPNVELDLLAKSRLLVRVAEPFVDRVEVEGRTVQVGFRFVVVRRGPPLPLKPDPLDDDRPLRFGMRRKAWYGPYPQAELPWAIALPPGSYAVEAFVGDMADPEFTDLGHPPRTSFLVRGGLLFSLEVGESEEVELRYTLPKGFDEDWVRSLVAAREGKKPLAKIERLSATFEKVATRRVKELATADREGELAEPTAAPNRRPVIRGRAYLGDPSRPAANQKLWLYDAAAMEIHRHLHTDEQGNFTSGPLPQGEYFLLAKMIDGRTGEPTPYFVQSRPFYLYGEEPPRVELDLLIKSRLLIRAAGPFVDRVEVEGRTVQLGIRFDMAPVEPRLPLKPDPLADELAPRMGLRKDHSHGPFLKEDLPWTIAIPPGRYRVRATVGRLAYPHFKVRGRSVISYQLGGGDLSSLEIGEGEEVELRYTLPEGFDAWVRSLVASLEGKKLHTKIERPSAATLKKVATRKLPGVPTARARQATALYTGRTLDEWLAELKIERDPETLAKGIEAIGALRETGRDRELAEAIVEVAGRYDLTTTSAKIAGEGEVKQTAIRVFGQFDSPAAVSILIDNLEGNDDNLRRFALWVLQRTRPRPAPIRSKAKEAVPALLEVSENESPEFRRWALLVVAQIDPTSERVVQRHQDALSDDDPQVVLAAAQLLVKAAPDTEALVATLVELIRQKGFTVQVESIQQLAKLGRKKASAVAALSGFLQDEDFGRSQLSESGLVEAGGGVMYAPHNLRILLIATLGSLGPKAKDAIPLLKAKLEDKDRQIRQAAAEALKKIGEQ